jgi:hypothetical protein
LRGREAAKRRDETVKPKRQRGEFGNCRVPR